MILENDCSPSKLFLCQVIYCSYGSYSEYRSELCQELILRMHQDEICQLKQREMEYLCKIRKGWEPTKTESIRFFSTFPIVAQAYSEWKNQIIDTHSFITWMNQLQQWRQLYSEDEIPEEDKELLYFVSLALASYALYSLDVCMVVAHRVVHYIEELDFASESRWFSPYSPDFSREQRDSWLQTVQKVLYQHLGDYNLDVMQTYLENLSPPPSSLLATLAVLRQDYSLAEQLLLETGVPIGILIPLTQYFISHGEETLSRQYLRELSVLVHLSKRPEHEAWLSFLQFTATLNPAYLDFSPTDMAMHWYVVFTVLKLAPVRPDILSSLPDSLRGDVDALLGTASDLSLEAAMRWLETNAGYGETLRSLLTDHPEVESLLSAEDVAFVEYHESSKTDPKGLLQKRRYYRMPLLVLRKCSRQATMEVLRNDFDRIFARLMRWRQKSAALPITEDDRVIELIRSKLLEALVWIRFQHAMRAMEIFLETREYCECHKYALWRDVCTLTYSVGLVDQRESVVNGGRAVLDLLPLFMKLRQKELVKWTVAVVSVIQERRDIVEQLLAMTEEEEELAVWLKDIQYP